MSKVFETRFGSSAEAVAYAESAGWCYRGYGGVLRRYGRYEGVQMVRASAEPDAKTTAEIYQLRIYQDGHVSLYAIGNTSAVSTSALPSFVWISADMYSYTQHMKHAVNSYLGQHEAGIFVGQTRSPRRFVIMSDDGDEVAEVEFPTEALSHPSNKSGMSDEQVQAFVDELLPERTWSARHDSRD